MRPVLKPALRRLWRNDATIQFGVSARHAVVVTGLVPPAPRLLDLLDGTRDAEGVIDDARELGVDAGITSRLLGDLARSGVLDDASADHTPLAALSHADRQRLTADIAVMALQHGGLGGALTALHRRRTAAVEVVGAGRVGVAVAALLAVAGVGAITVDDDGCVAERDIAPGGFRLDHVGQPRRDAAADLLKAISADVGAGPHDRAPDLVVHCPRDGRAVDGLAGSAPTLLAVVRETVGTVGPLVVRGQTPCLHCLDLHRTERDPAWPALLAQLQGPGAAPTDPETTLAARVAATAASAALRFLDSGVDAATMGATLDLSLDDWRTRRRTWSIHPECPCSPAVRQEVGTMGG